MKRMDRSAMLVLHDYNAYANELVLNTAARLSSEDLSRPSSPSRGSVLGLLNHMLETETFFLALCQGQPLPDSPLDEPLHPSGELRRLFAQVGQARGYYLDAVSEELLAEAILVRIGEGEYSLPRWQLLAQSLIHVTHHRGELSIVLTGLGAPLPTLDPILLFMRESGQEWIG